MAADGLDPRPEPVVVSAEALQPPPVEDGAVDQNAPVVAVSPALAPGPGSPSRGSKLRWIAATLVVVAAVGGALAAAVILGAKPLPEALRYLPADSVVVVELRPELPGDQRQHLGNFLAHLPGFADQSTLSDKIDEVLDRLVGRISNGAVDYAKQVKPLLAGPMTAAMSQADIADLGAGRTPSGLLIVATTDGKATCDGIFGSTTAGETHRTVEIRAISADVSCALDGRFLLLGNPAAISAGIDARRDGKGIDGSSAFRSARERLSGDQLALAYVDGKAVAGSLESLAPSLGIDVTLGSSLPGWLIAGVRVVDDALQVEMISPPVTAPALASGLPTDPPPAGSHFAAMLPADAFGFIEAHGMGANIERALAMLEADPAQATALQTLEQALTSVGGVHNLTSWIEDLGVAGVPAGDSVGAVVLIRGTDAAATRSRFDQIRNLLTLAATGTDITLRTADHKGVAVTTVDLGDLGPTLESLGAPPGLLGSGTHASFSMAVKSDVLMLGLGDGVIEGVLDVDPSRTLASSGTYSRVVALAGTPNDVEVFVALDAVAAWLEAHAPAGTDLGDYRQNVKPYLDHLAGVMESSVTTTTGTNARIVITVK